MTVQNETFNENRQIEKNEKRLRALVSATADVIYRLSADWGTLYEMDGRGFLSDFTEPSTNWLKKNVHPDEIPRIRIAIAKAIHTKSVFEMEHRVIRSDGSCGWTFSRAVPILGDDGEIIEWFGAASDITMRKNAEEQVAITSRALENSTRLYEAITGNTPDLMYVFNLDYRFIYANAALLTMWGRSYEDSMGRGLIELGYEPWHAEMHEREIDQVRSTKQMIRGEVSFPHATLGKRIYDYIFSPVLDDKGDVVAVAGTTRDISDLKAAEEALKQGQEKLEQLVAERTKELRRSNDDLLQFAHVASHDLKEPLRKFRTFAGMLETEMQNALTENAAVYLRKINSAAERMNSMIDGVLAYSKLSNHQQQFVSVDLNEVMNSIETDLEIVIRSKHAKISYNDLPVVQGAPVLLYQLLYNLVNNSLKFTRDGVAPVITLKAEKTTRNNDTNWAISVQDNGIGFPQQYSEKIFQTFTRLNARDRFEGTGLGLALCKKITERHNGSITARSSEGEGALFEIILPAT